jgi:hypothetical protein
MHMPWSLPEHGETVHDGYRFAALEKMKDVPSNSKCCIEPLGEDKSGNHICMVSGYWYPRPHAVQSREVIDS